MFKKKAEQTKSYHRTKPSTVISFLDRVDKETDIFINSIYMSSGSLNSIVPINFASIGVSDMCGSIHLYPDGIITLKDSYELDNVSIDKLNQIGKMWREVVEMENSNEENN